MVLGSGVNRAQPHAGVRAQTVDDYLIKRGDTLSALAQRFGVPLPALLAANPQITNPDLIFAGQRLALPAQELAREPAAEEESAEPPVEAPPAEARTAPRGPAKRPGTHTIRQGDTLWGLARRYQLSEQQLRDANPGVEPRRLQIGQKLQLPRSTPPAQTRPKARPAGVMQTKLQAEAEAAEADRAELVRKVKNEVVELAAGQDVEFERTFEFGDAGSIEAKWKGEILEGGGRRAEQRAFTAAERAQGRDVLWLETEGEVELDLKRDGENTDLDLDGELKMTLTRPYSYPKGEGEPFDLARTAVDAAVRPPLDADDARALERGSRFTLQGELTAQAKYDGEEIDVRSRASGRAELEVERGKDDLVRVTVATSRNLDLLDADARLDDGRITASADVERDRGVKRSYELDLSKPEARAAYEDLTRFDTSTAQTAEGVKLLSERETFLRREAGQVGFRDQGGDGTTLQGSLRVERRETHLGERRTVEGQIGAQGPAGENVRVEGQLSGGRTVVESTDGEITETNRGKLTAGARGTGETTWSGGLLIERQRVVNRDGDGETGSITRTGVLEAKGSVNPEVGEAKLGFGAEARLNYRFQTPLDAENAELPLDAERARGLPEGSELSLRGRGKVSATLARDTLGLDLSGDRTLDVRVRRHEGDKVTVSVDEVGVTKNGRNIEWSSEGADTPSWGLGYDGSTEQRTRSLGRYDLNLSNPQHREVYDDLVRGDTERADALGLRSLPRDEDRLTQRDRVTGEAKVNEWLGIEASVQRTSMSGEDPKVRADAERRAFTEAQEAAGKDVRWVQYEGSVAPSAGRTFSDPVTAGVAPTARLEAERRLAISAMVPSVDGEAPSVEPPLTARAALDLPRGSEFLLEREGSVAATLGLKAGYELENPGVRVGASAELSSKTEAESGVGVRVRRLADSKVEVSLEDTEKFGQAFRLALRAGVQVDTEALTGVDVPLVSEKVDEQVNRWLQVEVSASQTTRNEASKEMRFVLDLDRPEARAAYEALLDFDGRPALELGGATRDAGANNGVAITRTIETEKQSEASRFAVRVGPDNLFLHRALRSDSTRIEQWNNGFRRRDESRYERERENLLGRDRDVDWQAVWVRTNEEPEGRGFYRMTFEDKNPHTGRKQVRRAIQLARELEAEPVRPLRVEERRNRGPFQALLGDRHGKTTAELDVFITQKGIEGLGEHSEADAYEAYAQVLMARGALPKMPGWARRDIGPDARSHLDELARLEDDHFPGDDREHRDAKRRVEVRYWRTTGENVWEEDEEYATARAFADMVGRIRAGEDPSAWGRAFADLGEEAKFDMYDAVAAMNRLAGSDEVLVNKLAIQGSRVDVEMRSEGRVDRP